MKIPNLLTIIRFLLIPVISVLLYSNNPHYVLATIPLFIFSIITDYADGEIARKFKQKSTFGTFFDPLVDKMLILTVMFIFSDLKLIPVWLVLLILFRELLVTGIRQVCSKPKKVVGANWMGKSKFSLQAILVCYIMFVLYFEKAGINISINNIFLFTRPIAFYFALLVTVVSIAFAFNFLYWHRKEIMSDL
jgi:CDP-diacylglycerol--glycerol-3-phosphate 3-phosphatidyltransferase